MAEEFADCTEITEGAELAGVQVEGAPGLRGGEERKACLRLDTGSHRAGGVLGKSFIVGKIR